MKNELLESYSIGLKLRALRNEKRLTLARLASETGLSTALLSKLETDRMIPTLPTLAKICRVFGIGLSHFFAEGREHSLAITRKAHILDRARGESLQTIPLHLPTATGRMVARIIDFPRDFTARADESGQRTELVAYVLTGALRLISAGAQDVLETGDCVVLDTEGSVIWGAAGDSRCRALIVTKRHNV